MAAHTSTVDQPRAGDRTSACSLSKNVPKCTPASAGLRSIEEVVAALSPDAP
jgi:hypothetical protein